jgi:hypothetical protein
MEEENKTGKYLLAVVVAIIFLWVAKDWGKWLMPKNWTTVFIVICIWVIGELPFWVSRYYMSWFVCDGARGSFNQNDSPLPVPDSYINKNKEVVKFNWLVYGLGANRYPFPMRGKIETVIVPEVQVDRRALNHKCDTKVSPIAFENLPPRLFEELLKRKDDYNLKKIKIGIHGTSFQYTDFKDIDLELENKKINSSRNELSKLLDKDFDGYEKIKEITNRLKDKPTWGDRISGIFNRNPQADQQGA